MNNFDKAAYDKFRSILMQSKCDRVITSHQYKVALGQFKKDVYDSGCIMFCINKGIDLKDIISWLRCIIIASWQGAKFSNDKYLDDKYVKKASHLLLIISRDMMLDSLKYKSDAADPNNLMRLANVAYSYSYVPEIVKKFHRESFPTLNSSLYVEKSYNANRRIYGEYRLDISNNIDITKADSSHPK